MFFFKCSAIELESERCIVIAPHLKNIPAQQYNYENSHQQHNNIRTSK